MTSYTKGSIPTHHIHCKATRRLVHVVLACVNRLHVTAAGAAGAAGTSGAAGAAEVTLVNGGATCRSAAGMLLDHGTVVGGNRVGGGSLGLGSLAMVYDCVPPVEVWLFAIIPFLAVSAV